MSLKTWVWLGAISGSIIGSFIGELVGWSTLTFANAVCSAAVGLLGIWLGFTIGRNVS